MTPANKNQGAPKKSNFSMSIIVAIGVMLLVAILVVTKNYHSPKNIEKSLINPVLSTELGDILIENQAVNVENELKAYENSLIAKGDILNLSVYFRNLTNGNWFGIEEKELFSPASLMKLPLLMAYFKKDEQQPGYLQTTIKFTPNGSADEYRQNIVPAERLQANHTYKIIDIIKHMITYSDNEASVFLEKNINPEAFKAVFADVGIVFPPLVEGTFDNNIRVVDYAAFFRVLYNASYLTKQNSQEVLKLLTQTEFKDGLVAGVSDKGIAVSHKFGERSIWGSNGIERMQLHDCGIVYYPDHPYVLCLMTRGYNWDKLKEVLHQASNIVYQAVEKQYISVDK